MAMPVRTTQTYSKAAEEAEFLERYYAMNHGEKRRAFAAMTRDQKTIIRQAESIK